MAKPTNRPCLPSSLFFNNLSQGGSVLPRLQRFPRLFHGAAKTFFAGDVFAMSVY
jgi:hypothetical protein